MPHNDGPGELYTMALEQNDYNEHEVMANLMATVYHMVDTKIMELYQGVWKFFCDAHFSVYTVAYLYSRAP